MSDNYETMVKVDALEAALAEIARLRAEVADLERRIREVGDGLHPNYYHCDECGWDYVSTHNCDKERAAKIAAKRQGAQR